MALPANVGSMSRAQRPIPSVAEFAGSRRKCRACRRGCSPSGQGPSQWRCPKWLPPPNAAQSLAARSAARRCMTSRSRIPPGMHLRPAPARDGAAIGPGVAGGTGGHARSGHGGRDARTDRGRHAYLLTLASTIWGRDARCRAPQARLEDGQAVMISGDRTGSRCAPHRVRLARGRRLVRGLPTGEIRPRSSSRVQMVLIVCYIARKMCKSGTLGILNTGNTGTKISKDKKRRGAKVSRGGKSYGLAEEEFCKGKAHPYHIRNAHQRLEVWVAAKEYDTTRFHSILPFLRHGSPRQMPWRSDEE